MANVLDLMTEEDREKSLNAFQKRMRGDTSYRTEGKISPTTFLLSEFGYYYGWEAIAAAKRGYVEGFDEINQKRIKIPLTMEEIAEYVEGARKVWYSKLIDQARGTQVAAGSVMSKSPNKVFKDGMRPFKEATKL